MIHKQEADALKNEIDNMMTDMMFSNEKEEKLQKSSDKSNKDKKNEKSHKKTK